MMERHCCPATRSCPNVFRKAWPRSLHFLKKLPVRLVARLWHRERTNELGNTDGLNSVTEAQGMQLVIYMVFFTSFAWLVIALKSHRRLVATTLAGIMVLTLIGVPQPAQAQIGIVKAIEAVLNVINGPIQTALSAINTARTAMNNFEQLAVWPQQLINQIRAQVIQMIGQYRNRMSNILETKLNSASLPAPQALEAIIRDHQAGNYPALTAMFTNNYGAIPAVTAASAADR